MRSDWLYLTDIVEAVDAIEAFICGVDVDGGIMMTMSSVMEHILDLARWAPSGDNTQPWRFEIRSERHLVIHGFDTRDQVVYDLQGCASQLALGGLLETLEIAAQGRGWRCEIRRRVDLPAV